MYAYSVPIDESSPINALAKNILTEDLEASRQACRAVIDECLKEWQTFDKYDDILMKAALGYTTSTVPLQAYLSIRKRPVDLRFICEYIRFMHGRFNISYANNLQKYKPHLRLLFDRSEESIKELRFSYIGEYCINGPLASFLLEIGLPNPGFDGRLKDEVLDVIIENGYQPTEEELIDLICSGPNIDEQGNANALARMIHRKFKVTPNMLNACMDVDNTFVMMTWIKKGAVSVALTTT